MRDRNLPRTRARFAGQLSLDTGHNLISVGAGSSTLIMRRVSKLASPQKLWKLALVPRLRVREVFHRKSGPPASLRHIIPNSAVGIATKRRNRHKTKAFEARCRSGSSSSGGETIAHGRGDVRQVDTDLSAATERVKHRERQVIVAIDGAAAVSEPALISERDALAKCRMSGTQVSINDCQETRDDFSFHGAALIYFTNR